MESKPESGPAQRIFVKADEVDTGTSILSPGKQLPLSALAPPDASAPAGNRPKAPPRPFLRREGSAPPPPSQPPPAPPVQALPDNPTDSLSLPQLKQLVSQFPKTQQRAYAFQYSDTQGYADEILDWFHYSEQDQSITLCSRDAFEEFWKSWTRKKHVPNRSGVEEWLQIDTAIQAHFVKDRISSTDQSDRDSRIETLECLAYILFGAWSITSGTDRQQRSRKSKHDPNSGRTRWSSVQIAWMQKGAELLASADNGNAVRWLYQNLEMLTAVASRPKSEFPTDTEDASTYNPELDMHEMRLTFTCLYLLVEAGRRQERSRRPESIRNCFRRLDPDFLVFLVDVISRFRWDEDCNIPLKQVFQLFWKSLLLLFGDMRTDLEHSKSVLQPRVDPFSSDTSRPILTASPLEYHLFRQEITSKYPSYNPPLPLVPLEIEHRSMLPPLPYSHKQDQTAMSGFTASNTAPGGSILHQPVHIATPAPSPPPSPIGPGGKTGKKQNYQTNQNFPFLYPPLDDSSNMIGGRGSTEFQDMMVGRKWEGSDIPASIIEAGELFASRMRMTRAMRQLWKERDMFMKYDRGWRGSKNARGDDEKQQSAKNGPLFERRSPTDDDQGKIEGDNDLKQRLKAVDSFFHKSLPNLQSLVIVMMKVMLRNVQEIAIQNGGLQEGGQNGGLNRTKSNANMTQNQSLPLPPAAPQPHEMSIEDLEAVRIREISQQALSGAIFVMLKWFKMSHVLKFEYMTQLLLDSNYLQLTLKYFAHQNLEDLIAIKYERDDLGFFHFCHLNSDHPPLSPTSPAADSDTSSIDEAMPPPILRHRQLPTETSPPKDQTLTTPNITSPPRSSASPLPMNAHPADISSATPPRPIVDELGNPISPLPSTPIQNYSFRTFQTSIHLLRTLQKLTHHKSHRILLLVQFKSSTILRRLLRIPDPTLRLYVLKLVKSQVPYCGRKWRQSNMRVITAVYLEVRPELRDEWLSTATSHDGMGPVNPGSGQGSGAETDVDEAVPMEWALRGLTFWWMKRVYPDVMKIKARQDKGNAKEEAEWEGGQEIEEEERDFFQRELDAMGWGIDGMRLGVADEDVEFGEEAPGVNSAGVGERTNGVVMQGGEGGTVNVEVVEQ